jgi:hypothetical protein
VPGQVLTASDVNNYFVDAYILKTADESVTSSTTLQNDDVLVLPVLANATYDFYMYLDYEGGTLGASDLKLSWSNPVSSTMRYQCSGIGTGGGWIGDVTRQGSDTYAVGTNGAGNLKAVTFFGTMITAGTAGPMQFQWAQNTSSGTATKVHAQSCFALMRTG